MAEEGQDGTSLGELRLSFKEGKPKDWKWQSHVIDSKVKEDRHVAGLVARVRAPFVSGPAFTTHVNPFHGGTLETPIDTVVGYTQVGLHRSNFSDEVLPGVIEGTAQDFLTDAFRAGRRRPSPRLSAPDGSEGAPGRHPVSRRSGA